MRYKVILLNDDYTTQEKI
ncbi:ATP-dependent Clp protease adaptor ClpS [Helicobacter sp. UBA3407]